MLHLLASCLLLLLGLLLPTIPTTLALPFVRLSGAVGAVVPSGQNVDCSTPNLFSNATSVVCRGERPLRSLDVRI